MTARGAEKQSIATDCDVVVTAYVVNERTHANGYIVLPIDIASKRINAYRNVEIAGGVSIQCIIADGNVGGTLGIT